MAYETILYSVEEEVATLTLNRPEVQNVKTDTSLYSARTSTQSVWRIPQKDWKCLYSRKIVS